MRKSLTEDLLLASLNFTAEEKKFRGGFDLECPTGNIG